MLLRKINSKDYRLEKSPMLRDESRSSSDPFASSEESSPSRRGKLDGSLKNSPLKWNDLEDEKEPGQERLERYDSAMKNEGRADWSMENSKHAARVSLQPIRS